MRNTFRFAIMSVLVLTAIGMVIWLFAKCSSENYTDIEILPTRLFDGFESYSCRAQIERDLHAGLKYTVMKGLTTGTTRPPHVIDHIKVENYVHLGEQGRLTFTFFNDRLMSITFYPENLSLYLEKLAETGINLNGKREASSFSGLVVWTAIDIAGNSYVCWANCRLLDQHNRWIEKYS